ncbi:MAG: zinc ribbon domain-containing protein, partial [Deltaproteobacteria bacterium]|nr:zinc ribbon domain-containing protein [Deltaproteobacteria bacterium]
MPVYEYEHREKPCAMGKVFDINQSINDKQLTRCPAC